MTTKLNARIGEVTERIAQRSRPSRQVYLARIDAGNLAGAGDKAVIGDAAAGRVDLDAGAARGNGAQSRDRHRLQ